MRARTADAVTRLAGVIAGLSRRPGRAFDASGEVHRLHIEMVLSLGQYVLMTEPCADRLLGAMGWWRLDDDALRILREQGAEALVRDEVLRRIDAGAHCHISFAMVAPWAPRSTYSALAALVKAENADAKTISTVFVNRRGKRTWRERAIPTRH